MGWGCECSEYLFRSVLMSHLLRLGLSVLVYRHWRECERESGGKVGVE